jgi:hypothetical protein
MEMSLLWWWRVEGLPWGRVRRDDLEISGLKLLPLVSNAYTQIKLHDVCMIQLIYVHCMVHPPTLPSLVLLVYTEKSHRAATTLLLPDAIFLKPALEFGELL